MKPYIRHSGFTRFLPKNFPPMAGIWRVNHIIPVLISWFVLLCGGSLNATVVDSSFYGFTVVIERSVGMTPDSLYEVITRDVGRWWSNDHTWSGNASNLSIEAVAGGCLCEKLSGGGMVKHMEVVWAERPGMLRMTGGLGPLQAMAVVGTMSIELLPCEAVTRIKITYTAGGYYKGGLQKIGLLVDKVMAQQADRLKAFAEGKL